MPDPTAISSGPLLDELRWRGLLHQTAGDGLENHLATPGQVAYAGFDPTSDSLTIGNFIPIKMLMHWQQAGYRPIALMGGATGLIGDPSGKEAERQLRSREEVEHNVAGQRAIMERLLDFDESNPNRATIVNNIDWLEPIGYVEMLRDVGKHFSVNMMVQKESVASRLKSREQGISYTEFSYMLLQAYDFLHLYREQNCQVQIGGSDQYGNIVSGMDLIRRECRSEENPANSYGITNPLVTKADGSKIGKTESGAIWLSADRTSPYGFYQFWLNVDDADVIQFLRWFTMMSQEEVQGFAEGHASAPHERAAHRALAEHMTDLIHGKSERTRAEAASGALFSGDVRSLESDLLAEVLADVPGSSHSKAMLEGDGVPLLNLLSETTLARSKREAREFLGNGAVSVNGVKVEADYALRTTDLLHGRTILLRRGKKSWHATRWS